MASVITVIESSGVYLPEKVCHTSEVQKAFLGPKDVDLKELSGIENRHWVAAHQGAFELALEASRACLAQSALSLAQIDAVVVAGISRFAAGARYLELEPALSVRLAKALGLEAQICWDLNNACSGFMTAIYLADLLLQTRQARSALVVSGEYISHLTHQALFEIRSAQDPQMASLTLGDAGAAFLLQSQEAEQGGWQGLRLTTFWQYSELCRAFPSQRSPEGYVMETHSARIAAWGIRHCVASIHRFLQDQKTSLSDYKHLIVHQISRPVLQKLQDYLQQDLPHHAWQQGFLQHSIASTANTATTTHPLLLHRLLHSGSLAAGDAVLCATQGSGLTIGCGSYTVPGSLSEPLNNEPHFELGVGALVLPAISLQPEDGLEVCAAEVHKAMQCSGLKSSDIDLLIFHSSYKFGFEEEPALATRLARCLKLGQRDVLEAEGYAKFLAFDMLGAAAGVWEAVRAAALQICLGKHYRALVVSYEAGRAVPRPHWLQNSGEVLAMVLQQQQGVNGLGVSGFWSNYVADTQESRWVQLDLQKPLTLIGFQASAYMQRFNTVCADFIKRYCEYLSWDIRLVAGFILPCWSLDQLAALKDMLGLRPDQVINCQGPCGFDGGSYASVLHKWQESGHSGPVVVIAVSAGFSLIGCVLQKSTVT